MVFFADRLTLDAPRKLKDGYLAVRAKACRTGVYEYSGREIDPTNEHGLRDKAVVHVLRDDRTVFDRAAVQSFIGKPVTDDHPSVPVTADNWKDYAGGTIMGAIREGEYVAFDLLLTDAGIISKVEGGKRELSNGYGAELEFGSFTAPDGTVCDARQSKITGGNHVALVDRGRAGSSCAIADAASCEGIPRVLFDELVERTYNNNADDGKTDGERRETSNSQSGSAARQDGGIQVATKTIIVDGLQVEVTDQAEAAIKKLQGQVADAERAKGEAEKQVATLTTDKTKLEAEKATLEQQVKDAAITPEKLRDAAKSYAAVVGKAKALGVEVTDSMDEPAIMKAVVEAKIGDAAKDWNDVQVAASFATLTKDAKADALRSTIASQPIVTADASAVRDLARAAQY